MGVIMLHQGLPRQSLFRVLDEDGSGDIAYTEFVEQVVKMSVLVAMMLPPLATSNVSHLRRPWLGRHAGGTWREVNLFHSGWKMIKGYDDVLHLLCAFVQPYISAHTQAKHGKAPSGLLRPISVQP